MRVCTFNLCSFSWNKLDVRLFHTAGECKIQLSRQGIDTHVGTYSMKYNITTHTIQSTTFCIIRSFHHHYHHRHHHHPHHLYPVLLGECSAHCCCIAHSHKPLSKATPAWHMNIYSGVCIVVFYRSSGSRQGVMKGLVAKCPIHRRGLSQPYLLTIHVHQGLEHEVLLGVHFGESLSCRQPSLSDI